MRARVGWPTTASEDDADGRASYELDFPNGGDVTLLSNRIGQSRHTRNLTLIAYGAEGQAWPAGRLLMRDNQLINPAAFWAPLVRLWTSRLPGGVDAVAHKHPGSGRRLAGWCGALAGHALPPHIPLKRWV